MYPWIGLLLISAVSDGQQIATVPVSPSAGGQMLVGGGLSRPGYGSSVGLRLGTGGTANRHLG